MSSYAGLEIENFSFVDSSKFKKGSYSNSICRKYLFQRAFIHFPHQIKRRRGIARKIHNAIYTWIIFPRAHKLTSQAFDHSRGIIINGKQPTDRTLTSHSNQQTNLNRPIHHNFYYGGCLNQDNWERCLIVRCPTTRFLNQIRPTSSQDSSCHSGLPRKLTKKSCQFRPQGFTFQLKKRLYSELPFVSYQV